MGGFIPSCCWSDLDVTEEGCVAVECASAGAGVGSSGAVADISCSLFERVTSVLVTSCSLSRKFVTSSFFVVSGKGVFVQKLFYFYFYHIIAVRGTPPLWHQPAAGPSGFRVKLNSK